MPTITLTVRQAEIVAYIDRHWREHGHSPSVREIGSAVGIGSPNGVLGHLRALRRKGVVVWCYGKRRTLRLVGDPLPSQIPAPTDPSWQHVGRSREISRLSAMHTPPPSLS